ncbi:ArsA family ATPase [Paracoccus nototheniae]|uniref:arsenite-transporting ATPase n=1 Tax=Paracoccus nototheniae TaxID=2489002 RepID=A0ABW4E2N7_9RHOB|nr:ArsA family ATPase [Paracoccus nototheniae]
MLLDLLGRRGLIVFGGKGGVGKTTVSASAALALAGRGRRVCLVSTDPAHNLGHLFERAIGPHPVTIAPNLTAIELDPDQAVTDHLAQVGDFLAQVMPRGGRAEIDRHLSRARHAPGMAEAALLDRIAELAAGIGETIDHLVLDTAPTGHTLTLLALPEMMTAWTDGMIANRVEADRFSARARALATGSAGGDPRSEAIRQTLTRRRARLAGLRDHMTDPARTTFVAVTTPERMPVQETLALGRALDQGGIPLGAIVVNRIPPNQTPDATAARLAPLRQVWPDLPMAQIAQTPSEPTGVAPLQDLALALGGDTLP